MTEAIETADAAESAAFAAMQKGEDQPGSDQLPKEQPTIDGEAAPAPESGSKETAQAETQPAPAADPANKVVPIQALDAERDKRKAAQEAARLKEGELAEARARLKAIAEMQRNAVPNLNVDEDPVAATRALVAELAQDRAARVQMEQAKQVLVLSQEHEAAYAQHDPEYVEAINHLHKQVIGELMNFEGLTFEQATDKARLAAAMIAQNAMANGINPAIPLKALSISRGFRPGAAAQPAPLAQAPVAAVAQPDPNTAALAAAAKTLETIAAGQQAARSGAGMRGGADTPPSLREIAELSASDDPEDIKRVEAFWKGGGVKRAMG